VSGGHFNPVVSLVDAAFGGLSRRDAFAYVPVQIAGCMTGAVVANAMFALSAVSIATTHRASPAHVFAEVVATFGLLLLIFALVRSGRAATAAAAVGAYIGAAYWFTSSTSFANPAITVGRIFSDTFAGIAPRFCSSVRHRPTDRRADRLRGRSHALPRRRAHDRRRCRCAARQRDRRGGPARRTPCRAPAVAR
jgi:glycerol uptake facilitator-like aquaporin